MKATKLFGFASVLVLLFSALFANSAQAVTVTRNTSFSSGLTGWNVNPDISSATWVPLVTHPDTGNAVNIHPDFLFQGTVIYQNLKVTGIAGKSFKLSARLTQNSAPAGKTVALYLDYVDNSNIVHNIKVLNPDNSSITSNTLVSADYVFPADARKLIKLEVAKENYGDFIIDNIVLSTADTVTVGAVPSITSVTPASGPYGTAVTIEGENFSAVKGTVTIRGSSAGITVNNWTGTQIQFTVQDPAHSGEVNVVSDFVESNIDKSFEVTSPNYSARLLDNSISVVKGATAEFIVRIDFNKGFTSSGINFSVGGSAALASRASFTPAPLANSGGVLLKIDTSTLSPGRYQASVKSTDSASAPQSVPFTLEVVTVPQIRFFEYDAESNKVYITSKDVTEQGQIFGVGIEARDANAADHVAEVALVSSNPGILGVYKRLFGYEVYAGDTGTATITASTPDGASAVLTVNMTIAAPKITSISVSPSQVGNTYADTLSYSALGSQALEWVGYDNSGLINFNTPDFFDNLVYSGDSTGGSSAFHITGPTDLGTVLFYAQTGSSKRVAPLNLVNGPSTGELRGAINVVDSTFAEVFRMDFYAATDSSAPVFSRDLFLMHGDKSFAIGGIPPGSYKVKVSDPDDAAQIDPQWYPNSRNFAGASAVTFSAGQVVQDIYFFVRAEQESGPNIEVSPVSRSFSNTPVGATSAAQKVTVYNRGSAGLSISSVTLNGTGSSSFNQTNNCSTVAVNKSCVVNVTFSPDAEGAVTAYLEIQSNDADASVVALLLRGTGFESIASPTALSAKATGPAKIVLGWTDNAANETGFMIERKPGSCAAGGAWTEIGTAGANALAFTSTGLTASTTYSYKLRAYNAYGYSSYTACVNATTGVAGTPDSPNGLKATAASAGKVDLEWTYSAADAPDFKIYRNTGASFLLLATVKTKNYTDANAAANYSYYVKACNATGCSPSTSTAIVPPVPGSFAASASADLTWTDSGSNETGFQVQRKAGNCASVNSWALLATLAADATAYHDAGAVSGNTYSYRIRAYSKSAQVPVANGYSPYTACRNVTVAP
jgi:hypothetical protein